MPLILKLVQALLASGVLLSSYPAFARGDFRYVAVACVFAIVLAVTLAPMSAVAKQVAVTLSLLIAVNLLTTPLVSAPYRTLTPNYSEQIRIVGDVMPGFSGVQAISTDAKGFRTNTPIDYAKKPPGALRLFAIGGSTTEQIYLDDQKTWVSLLASALERGTGRKVEAVNTGVSGLRAEHHVATIEKIAVYQPDLVIVMMGINDWDRHIRRGGAHVEYFYTVVEHLDLKESLLAKAYRRFSKVAAAKLHRDGAPAVREENGSYYTVQNDSLSRPKKREFYPREVSRNYARNVQAIADVCREHGVTCLFTDQPTAYRPEISPELRKRLWMTPVNERYSLSLENLIYVSKLYNSWLQSFASSAQIPFCNLAATIPPTTAYFFDDCHFNEGGARKVADLLTECVVGHGLLAVR